MKQKIIVFDFLVYVHIIAYCHAIPEYGLIYQILNMMTSHLRKIGLNENDQILVAKDKIHGEGNRCWRYAYENQYKHGRSDARQKSGRNWTLIWKLAEELQEHLEWVGIQFLEFPTMEADDFYAVLPKVITDKELVFVTIDSDIEQCWNYPNVKLFSPKKIYKSSKGAWKIRPDNFDINKFIAKKIKKEVSDGLEKEVITEEDYDNRKLCVDLINLPEFVVNPLSEIIKKIDLNVKYNWSDLPYIDKFKERIERAYRKDDVLTIEQCKDFFIKKETRKKTKVAKQKALLKAAKNLTKEA